MTTVGSHIRIAAGCRDAALRGAVGRIAGRVYGQLGWWWVALVTPPQRLALGYRDPAGQPPLGHAIVPGGEIEIIAQEITP